MELTRERIWRKTLGKYQFWRKTEREWENENLGDIREDRKKQTFDLAVGKSVAIFEKAVWATRGRSRHKLATGQGVRKCSSVKKVKVKAFSVTNLPWSLLDKMKIIKKIKKKTPSLTKYKNFTMNNIWPALRTWQKLRVNTENPEISLDFSKSRCYSSSSPKDRSIMYEWEESILFLVCRGFVHVTPH